MNPTRIVAAGRSEFQPVDPADKAKNRRIEIIISPDLDELFDIIQTTKMKLFNPSLRTCIPWRKKLVLPSKIFEN